MTLPLHFKWYSPQDSIPLFCSPWPPHSRGMEHFTWEKFLLAEELGHGLYVYAEELFPRCLGVPLLKLSPRAWPVLKKKENNFSFWHHLACSFPPILPPRRERKEQDKPMFTPILRCFHFALGFGRSTLHPCQQGWPPVLVPCWNAHNPAELWGYWHTQHH